MIQEKAIELKSQFGANAKYVISEIIDEIKKFEYGNPILLMKRIEFWEKVKAEL